MRRYALVFVGGFCGTLARYALSEPLRGLASLALHGAGGIPVEILLINLSGTLALGFLYGLVEHGATISPEARLALGTGFLGAYTTFSTFAYGGDSLLRDGHALAGVLYLGGSIALGVVAAQAGLALAGLALRRQGALGAARAAERKEALAQGAAGAPDDLPSSVGAWGEGD